MVLPRQEVIKELLLKVHLGFKKEEVWQVEVQVSGILKLKWDRDQDPGLQVTIVWEEVTLLFLLLNQTMEVEVILLKIIMKRVTDQAIIDL